MRLEVDLAPTAVRDMRVALRRPEISVAEHLLDGPQVGSAFEKVRREGVSEEMRMDAPRFETRPVGELPQDQKCPCPRQWAAARVQEELRPVPTVEVRPAEGEVPANRFCGWASEGHQALLVALAEHTDDPLFECHAALLEPDRFGHAQTGAVEEFD